MRRQLAALGASLSIAASGCGYHALYAGDPAGAKLHVVLVRSVVADAIASDEVVSGVRDELAREGSLEAGDAYPRVEIEVLRIDESSDGITAARPASGGALTPVARATEVGLVARAWVVLAQGDAKIRDTGDVRALDLVAASPRGASDLVLHADAVRAVARRVGVQLGRRIMGHPVAEDESLGRER